MNPSRSFFLLAGVALLGALVSFDRMMAAGEITQATSPPPRQSTVTTHDVATDKLTDASAGDRSNADPPALAGNPLWELPLERFPDTRERPIFSPSRRPKPRPPANVARVVVRQATKAAEAERPAVSLVGTINGTDLQIGIFRETATQNVVRLRLGEDYQGWVLRLVKAREVTLVKDIEQTLVLEPHPGGATAVHVPTVLPLVPNSIGTVPSVNTADYVDEQPLPKRGAQRQRN